ncbi:hypothetical protein DMN91_003105 [Ooceraea biroi]|uniref:THAP-type domain-containing protein n=1 Tax=Ooceraea biroi TaxID=2015173 RepID=A0A3L8DXQ0_OOCBI|nr:hypothetical protein DMN91_003105 [Ooceraea biroi]
MPNRCCIAKCKNTNKQGYHLFQFPIKRPDILRMWLNAIGRDFTPTKSHVICSAHFLPADIMEKANVSGVVLKNLAVPFLFLEAPASNIAPTMKSGINSAIECGTTPAPTPAVKNVPAILWKSILKPKITQQFHR